jgi:hypothetical protein
MAGAKLNVAEACKYLGGISRRAFYDHVRAYVPSIAVGSRVVFDVDDLEAWAAQQKAMSSPAPAPLAPVDFASGRRKWKVGAEGDFVWIEPSGGKRGKLVRLKK